MSDRQAAFDAFVKTALSGDPITYLDAHPEAAAALVAYLAPDIEAEAVAAERRRIREAVEGLPYGNDPDDDDHPYVSRPAVLAIIDRKGA